MRWKKKKTAKLAKMFKGRGGDNMLKKKDLLQHLLGEKEGGKTNTKKMCKQSAHHSETHNISYFLFLRDIKQTGLFLSTHKCPQGLQLIGCCVSA